MFFEIAVEEAVVRKFFSKLVFLKILQYSQKKTVLESLSDKVAALKAAPCRSPTLLKRDSNTGVLLIANCVC